MSSSSDIKATTRYLIRPRIYFLIGCITAAVFSLALLINRSNMLKWFDLLHQSTSQEQHEKQMTIALIVQKKRYIEILDNYTPITIGCSLTALVDIVPRNFLPKFLFVLLMHLSVASECLFVLQLPPLLTPDDMYMIVYKLMFAQLLFFGVLLFDIIYSSKLYFRMIDRYFSQPKPSSSSSEPSATEPTPETKKESTTESSSAKDPAPTENTDASPNTGDVNGAIGDNSAPAKTAANTAEEVVAKTEEEEKKDNKNDVVDQGNGTIVIDCD